MKVYLFFVNFLFLINFNINCQTISISVGNRPNNLRGSHFSSKIDIYQRDKWLFGINYSFIRYTDSYAKPNQINPLLHRENKRDETLINFPELNRGYSIQSMERDFRPRDLIHRISLLSGFEIINNKNFKINTYAGPHYSFIREIYYYIAYDFAPITINEGDEPILIQYHDFQIYRSWDIGIGVRNEVDYKLFNNLYVGMNGQLYLNILTESLDLIVGGGITYNFNN